MATKNNLCLKCEKRLKSIHKLIKHINTCMNYQVFPIYMQPKQNTPIPGEEENLGPYENEKLTLEEDDIEKDYRNLEDKSLDIKSHARDGLAGCIPQTRLFKSKSSLSLRKVKFSD